MNDVAIWIIAGLLMVAFGAWAINETRLSWKAYDELEARLRKHEHVHISKEDE